MIGQSNSVTLYPTITGAGNLLCGGLWVPPGLGAKLQLCLHLRKLGHITYRS